MKKPEPAFRFSARHTCRKFALLFCGIMSSAAFAQDWEGAFTLVPVSAPDMVLEAVGSGTSAGTVVSIGKPSGTANQQWVIAPQGHNLYTLKPAYSTTLVLAVAQGGTNNGAAVVLESDGGEAWQV